MIGGVSPVFRNFAASTGRLAGLRDMGRDVARTRVRMRPGRRLEAPTAAEVLPLCCDDAMPPSCCAIPPPGGRNGAAVPGCRNVAPPLRPAAVMRCRRHALPSLRRVGGMALLFRAAEAWPPRCALPPSCPASVLLCHPSAGWAEWRCCSGLPERGPSAAAKLPSCPASVMLCHSSTGREERRCCSGLPKRGPSAAAKPPSCPASVMLCHPPAVRAEWRCCSGLPERGPSAAPCYR